ncbi:TetR/AcrR family transcriptional regulator [Dyella japonica]|uniref:TetR family transcriptional regulator n=1 Tax=Dyella japonica DSM 16301 TaxID=1440762 RepID=A0A0G9H6K5_9GAMM|nr:TetR/AcrR family transcriptional regulator [Dyella japonica]KLD64864.1 TetR family transcriptional regulator [Dyella japonica DSM 16301]
MARPRQFDEQKTLEAVAEAFWAHGYEGTSTRDLAQRTGLTVTSLYNAFGDKQSLFQLALQHYLDTTLKERIHRLEESLAPTEAIVAFFNEVIERSLSDVQQRGCFLVNSALDATPDAPELRAAIASEIDAIRAFFRRCLLAGRRTGDVPSTVSAAEASAHLLAVLLGLRVMARVNPDRATMTAAVSAALKASGISKHR